MSMYKQIRKLHLLHHGAEFSVISWVEWSAIKLLILHVIREN